MVGGGEEMFSEIPVGLRFSILHRAFRQQMDEYLKEQDLTGAQFHILCQIKRFEESGVEEINQKMLERYSRVTHPTMTEIIKKLEKKGFIRCETSTIDRRHKNISATEKSGQLHLDINRIEKQVFDWLCEGLSDKQKEQFTSITDIMLENAFKDCRKGSGNNCDKNPCKKSEGI